MKTIRRRRKQAKTDYKARLALLKSEKPRLVLRKTNKYIIAQLISSDIAQDKILASSNSKELFSLGWPENAKGSLKSLPAAYLTGFLLIKKLKSPPEKAVLDVGLNRSVKNSRLFAALKGAIDAGLSIPHNPKSLPDIERIKSSSKTYQLIERIKQKI